MSKMKVLKFKKQLVDKILDGSKTSTWRMFDDKDLKVGDIIELLDETSKEKFSEAEIVNIKEKKLREVDEKDFDGHEKYLDSNDMLKKYRGYYGDRVTMDTKIKMIDFKLK